MTKPAGKRTRLTLKDKLDAFHMLNSGSNHSEIMKKYNVSKRFVTKLRKDGDELAKKAGKSNHSLKAKSFRRSLFPDIEEAVLKHCVQRRADGYNVVQDTVKTQAIFARNQILERGGISDDDREKYVKFSASNGWCHKFLERHGFKDRHHAVDGDSPMEGTTVPLLAGAELVPMQPDSGSAASGGETASGQGKSAALLDAAEMARQGAAETGPEPALLEAVGAAWQREEAAPRTVAADAGGPHGNKAEAALLGAAELALQRVGDPAAGQAGGGMPGAGPVRPNGGEVDAGDATGRGTSAQALPTVGYLRLMFKPLEELSLLCELPGATGHLAHAKSVFETAIQKASDA